jgi:hypothetical protein
MTDWKIWGRYGPGDQFQYFGAYAYGTCTEALQRCVRGDSPDYPPTNKPSCDPVNCRNFLVETMTDKLRLFRVNHKPTFEEF